MAQHFEDSVNYYLSISFEYRNYLGDIRSFRHLKIGNEGGNIWIKGFTREEIDSVIVRAIPNIDRYYEKDNLLFKLNSRLPFSVVPSLLWTPVDRGLPIELPKENFNYFGVNNTASIQLIESAVEEEVTAMKIPVDELFAYLKTSSGIRLQNLKWVVMNDSAIVIGKPLLPLSGEVFWRCKSFFFPAGYTLNHLHLLDVIEEKIQAGNYIFLDKDKQPVLIPKISFRPLSLGGFRLTLSQFA